MHHALDLPAHVRVFLRAELLDHGLDDRTIARACAVGDLVRVRHGAYVTGVDWALLDAAGRHRVTARAAVRQSRTPVVVSHGSASVELGGPTWGLDLAQVHLTREDRKAGRSTTGLAQHRGLLRCGDVVERDGLRVTVPAVATLGVIATSSTEVGLVTVNHFLHAGAVTPQELEEARAAHEHWPGTLNAGLVLGLADARAESVGESRSCFAFWRGGLPCPHLQWEVRAGGRVVARLDFAWPRLGVFAEFDGKVKYGRLLEPGQSVQEVVDAEKQREELVCRLTGWRCVRLTWADLADPARIAWRVRQLAAHHRG